MLSRSESGLTEEADVSFRERQQTKEMNEAIARFTYDVVHADEPSENDNSMNRGEDGLQVMTTLSTAVVSKDGSYMI